MSEPAYKRCVSPVDKDSAKYAPEQSGLPDMEHAVYIENLKNVNEELRQARRAALNLMEDAIASKEALRKSEEKYRTLFDSMDEGYCIIQMMYNDDGKL